MRAIYFDGRAARLRTDYPEPRPGPDESLIRIRLAAICNTDQEILRGYKPDFRGVMGHEFVGEVIISGRAELVGCRVVGELNAGCGNCLYCKSGRERHCRSRRVIGLAHQDGCFAEYMTLRSDLLHTVPENMPDEQAIFTEPLAAALEIGEQEHIRPSQPAAVVGDGRLALMAAQALALTGAEVTVVGRHTDKLALFQPFAHTCFSAPEQSFELAVEASGSPSGLETAISLVRSGGRIILKSTYAGQVQADLSRLAVNEISLSGSRCGPFPPALRLLSRGLISLPPLELYELEDWERAFSSPALKTGFRLA